MKYLSAAVLGTVLLVSTSSIAYAAEEKAADRPGAAQVPAGTGVRPGAPAPASRASSRAILITAEEKKKEPGAAEGETGEVADPLEGLNRGVYKFNEGLDTVLVAPVARTYRYVVPEYGRDRVGNALNNINEPVNFLNNALQGNVKGTFASFWRFVINSTFGIGGMFDTASEAGLEPVQEDFGQTLATWGVGDGAYLVLPIIGPSSARDAIGLAVDTFTNPFSYLSTPAVVSIMATDYVDTRARLLDITDEIQRTSFDPYATVRSAYIQRRNTEIDKKAQVE